MLPRRHRLARRSELTTVLRRGAPARTGRLLVKAYRNGRPYSRFAFTVSNRVARRATVRNRLRRQLRESVRRLFPLLQPGYDVVVVVQPSAPVRPSDELTVELARCLTRLRLLPAPR